MGDGESWGRLRRSRALAMRGGGQTSLRVLRFGGLAKRSSGVVSCPSRALGLEIIAIHVAFLCGYCCHMWVGGGGGGYILNGRQQTDFTRRTRKRQTGVYFQRLGSALAQKVYCGKYTSMENGQKHIINMFTLKYMERGGRW